MNQNTSKKPHFFSFLSLKRGISVALIFFLLFSQTVRFDFLGTASAHADQHRDIISVIVDRETYSRISSEVDNYAKNIQNQRGSTRVVISVMDANTTPAMIAQNNEKLYYEGESSGVKTHLVGTILIGNVPIPMVQADGKYFPSIFPYVDFENKAFVYNSLSDQYEKNSSLHPGNESVEIWHGVINPAIGREWNASQDIDLIKNFLQKTDNFYNNTAKFTRHNEEPRVFYFDGFTESRSMDARSLFQYKLLTKNIENLAYDRFTKYLLKDINTALKNYDSEIDKNPHANVLSDEAISQSPDIHAATIIKNSLKNYHEIFNKKVLGEELEAIHNAGRYNSGSTVNADLSAVQVTLMDDIARDILKKANDSLEGSFDQFLEENAVARKIPIFDSMTAHNGQDIKQNVPYKNYFFGREAGTITSAEQCTITRGSEGNSPNGFGRGVLVEANVMFDINGIQPHLDILNQDAEYCLKNSPALNTFWGGNSPLRIANTSISATDGKNPLIQSSDSRLKGFVKDIYSLGGMTETSRLKAPSLDLCTNYEYNYVLEQPNSWTILKDAGDRGSQAITMHYPADTSGDRFRCRSDVHVLTGDEVMSSSGVVAPAGSSISLASRIGRNNQTPSEPIPLRPDANFFVEMKRYHDNKTQCLSGVLQLDDKKWENSQICQETITTGSGDNADSKTIDITNYRSLQYHAIPGILKRISPTHTEINAAEENGITHSLPIDINRGIEFITKKGHKAYIEYPNFFRMKGKTVADLRRELSEHANGNEGYWKKILEAENAINQDSFEADISENVLGAKNLPQKFDWNDYLTDEFLEQIIAAKQWIEIEDTVQKNDIALKSILSYGQSHFIPHTPNKNQNGYEIAYLGLSPVTPRSSSVNSSRDALDQISLDYQQKLLAIQGLNITESNSQVDTKSAVQCGPIDGVELQKWPAAVQCWMKAQTPPKITPGQCGSATIGYNHSKEKDAVLLQSKSIEEQKGLLDSAKIIPHFSRKNLSYNDSISFFSSLQNDTTVITPVDGTRAKLEIIAVTSEGKEISAGQYDQYFSQIDSDVLVTDGEAKFLIHSKDKSATLKAKVVYSIPFEGSIKAISSEEFDIVVSDAYLDIQLLADDQAAQKVSTDSSQKYALRITQKHKDSTKDVPEKDFSVKIFDDLSGKEVFQSAGDSGVFALPDGITKNVGVYRVVVTNSRGIAGEMTLSVQSGDIAKIALLPASSAIVKGSDSLVQLVLQDITNNPVMANLYSVEISAENGMLIDAHGNATEKLNLNIFDSHLAFSVRSQNEGKMKITAKVKRQFPEQEFVVEREIAVITKPSVALEIEGNPVIQIGEKEKKMRLKIIDNNGNIVQGFSSIAAISIPQGAGKFSHETVDIINGQSEIFSYYPGTLSGNNALSINIPGIGTSEEAQILLLSGDPMYIDSQISGGKITFFVRDRFGNVSSYDGQAFLSRNQQDPQEVAFQNGKLTIPEENGSYIIEIPSLQNNTIYYDEAGKIVTSGNALLDNIEENIKNQKLFQVLPISKYAVKVASKKSSYDFAEDYNARYTVLAGGSFVREGEDILYHTSANNSQSLAVTTLLDTPITESVVMNIFPNGSFLLGNLDDALLKSDIHFENGIPIVRVFDEIKKQQVASIGYQMNNARLVLCQNDNECQSDKKHSHIILKQLLSQKDGYDFELKGDKILVYFNKQYIFSVDNSSRIHRDDFVEIILKNEKNTTGMSVELHHRGNHIADLTFAFSGKERLQIVNDLWSEGNTNSPKVVTSGYQIEETSNASLQNSAKGIALKQQSLVSESFDVTKTSPGGIDDIGMLDQNPGVGWRENNRMLLSYAAGDSVGESTKWFHTYMMINMGDPMARVDIHNSSVQIDGLDRSIGTQIASSRRAHIQNFFERDMNADGLKDIVVYYIDGYIELLLNNRGNFRSMGNISYIPSDQNILLEFGDFSGDQFADVVYLDKEGKLNFILNKEGRFTPQEIAVNGANPPLHIQQMKIYDMDADQKDDIVYLTSGGELGILYGTASAGVFDGKILDSSLGIQLQADAVDRHGGALKSSFVDQIGIITQNAKNPNDARIRAEAYFQRQAVQNIAFSGSVASSSSIWGSYLQQQNNQSSSGVANGRVETFVKSQYASLAQAEIAKTYKSPKETLLPQDTIQAEIVIKNTSSQPMKDVMYLDSISSIFGRDGSTVYQVEVAGKTLEKPIKDIQDGQYVLEFDIGEIPAGSEAKIRYTLKVLPASYGKLLVGDFEKGTAGHDVYGDVAFESSTTCGAEKMLWISHNTQSRSYQSNTAPNTYHLPFPNGIQDKIADNDNNGIPDSIENISLEERKSQYKELSKGTTAQSDLITISKEGKTTFKVGFDQAMEKKIVNKTQEIMDGLSCGFGGGSCMSFPINWAPLAPGSDPVVMGSPVGDGFKVDEGYPIFSGLTGINVPTSAGCYQVPTVWPVSPFKFTGSCTTEQGAGGALGASSPTNFVRVFVTPTLTLGMGGAVCLGGPASVVGGNPGQGLFPLVQGGNCIVMSKPMPICKGDGSKDDGDVSGISGIGQYTDAWNGKSCNLQASPVSAQKAGEAELEKEIADYIKNPDEKKIAGISIKLSKKNVSSLQGGPLLNIGNTSAGADFEVSVQGIGDPNDISKVVDVKNRRIAAFPDFMMNWVTRQVEEISNSLLSPPNLTIIPPTDFGQNAKVDSTYANFLSQLKSAYSSESLGNMKSAMMDAYQSEKGGHTKIADTITASTGGWAGDQYKNILEQGGSAVGPGIDSVNGGINAMRSAYTFLGKLPFLNIRQTKIDINVPWILPSELDQYERKLKEYKDQVQNALADWCATDPSKECLEKKAKLNNSGLLSSIDANLKRIQEYRNFPEKLQKYVTWKEKLLYEILCNVEAIDKMTLGWIKDNGVRFEKWAELWVLIKAIAESWQPVLDIFADTNAQCGVCRNERHNSQSWKFKLISAIIPQIPVISFPKWPDIVLDLSDVRFGVDVSVPDFNFRLSPLRLPRLPNLSLQKAPNGSLTLPTLPVLPKLPELPDLPKLPSVPTVKLPDLPPPPKLPKLSGSIEGVLDIMKLIAKMYCFYQKTTLVPEWQVGDIIAQRTERQGTMDFDFIDVQFPQFSLPEIKEIRVSTHLQYMLRSDFITEYAKKAVEPINKFSGDLQSKIPSEVGSNVSLQSDKIPNQINVDVSAPKTKQNIDEKLRNLEKSWQKTSDDIEKGAQDAVDNAVSDAHSVKEHIQQRIAEFEKDKDVFLENEEFVEHFTSQLRLAGLDENVVQLQKQLRVAKKEARELQNELIEFNKNRSELIYKFLEEEAKKNGELQNVIDALRHGPSSDNEHIFGQFVSDSKETSSPALQQLALLEGSALPKVAPDRQLSNLRQSLNNKVQRIAQLTNTTSNATLDSGSTSSVNNNYLPSFNGIYVLTEQSQTQTKLFDYVDGLGKNDRVDVLDMDNDGDRDYVFVLEGMLYIKKTYLQNPEKILDKTLIKRDISDQIPEVPNNFIQTLSTPSELNISFQNTVIDEKEWRLEFFDNYLDWANIAISPEREKNIPKTTVDLFVRTDFGDFQNSIRSLPVKRYLKSGHYADGFTLQGPQITKLENDIFISISPSRTLYTGNNDVLITYRNSQDSDFKNMRLEPHTAYQFEYTTELRATNGPLYIIGGGSGNHRYTKDDKLDGLPLLPGMMVTSNEELVIQDVTHGEALSLSAGSIYMLRDIGIPAQRYNVVIPYPNGYYYGRLQHLSFHKKDRAGVLLMSPQLASDKTSPVISLEEGVRLPVYTTKSYKLSDIITELSSFGVTIDVDVSVDSDGNGVYDDDFVVNSDGVNISHTDIIFGSFNIPGTREMILKVRDEFGNVTTMPFSVEVFTPIPQIDAVSEQKSVLGKIDTLEAKEPIDIFRVRTSETPKILNKDSIFTNEKGGFASQEFSTEEQIIASSSSQKWNVTSRGLFTGLPAGFKTVVTMATTKNPMSIGIIDQNNEFVYQHTVSLPKGSRILDASGSSQKGNVVVSTKDAKFVPAPRDDKYIPGGAYIVDNSYNAMLVIARDGNIYSLQDGISLSLGEKDGYMMIIAKKNDNTFAEFHYQLDFFYTTK